MFIIINKMHFLKSILALSTFITINTSIIIGQTTYIQVISEPEISVFINDEYKGKTSSDYNGIIIENVSPGTSTIKVVKNGFNPQEETINIKLGEVYIYKVKPFIPKIKISQLGNEGQQQMDLKVGKIKIQSLPVSITISIPHLGVYSAKTQDEWIADDVPIGDYIAIFSLNNKSLRDTIHIIQNKLTHLFVNMIKEEIEDRGFTSEYNSDDLEMILKGYMLKMDSIYPDIDNASP